MYDQAALQFCFGVNKVWMYIIFECFYAYIFVDVANCSVLSETQC